MTRLQKKWFAWTAAVLIGLQLLYLVAANVLLASGAIERLANRQPEKIRVRWEQAYTLWPGQFHVERLRLAGHTRRVAWNAQADVVDGRVSLWPLLLRQLRFPVVEARGVAAGASRIDVERLPPAPRSGGWTLRFDRIDAADVRQANFGALVLRGAGTAAFSFEKQLRGGPMEIRPSQVTFTGADAWVDGEQFLQQTSLLVEFAVDRHLRAQARGLDKLLKAVATIEVDAETLGLRVEKRAAGRDVGYFARLDRVGRLAGKLAWNRGELESGSTLRVSMPIESGLSGESHQLGVAALIQADPQQVVLQLGVAPGAGSELHVDADLRIAGRAIPLRDPAALLQRTDGRVRGRWHFDSLRWLGDLIPGPQLLAFDGAGSVDVDLLLQHGALQSGSRIVVPEVAATAAALGNVFRGVASATVALASAPNGDLDTQLHAAMRTFSVAPVDAPERRYVEGRELRFEASAQGEPGRIRQKVQARLLFENASVPDLRVYNRYLPGTLVQLMRGTGSLSGDLRFDGEGDVASGIVRVTGKQAVVQVGDATLTGDLKLQTQLERADLKSRRFIADGSTLDVANMRVEQGGEVISDGWWGKVRLPAAKLRWSKPLQLDGNADISMRDLQPLLALFQQKKRFPAWVGRLVDEGELHAQGRISWGNGVVLVDEFSARNDRLEVLAQLRSRDKNPTGALYARWRKVDLAVALNGSDRDLHVKGAREWYEARPSLR